MEITTYPTWLNHCSVASVVTLVIGIVFLVAGNIHVAVIAFMLGCLGIAVFGQIAHNMSSDESDDC